MLISLIPNLSAMLFNLGSVPWSHHELKFQLKPLKDKSLPILLILNGVLSFFILRDKMKG
jgi:hypothetical protein